MLTQEQIKKLKPGDPLIINGTFVDLDDEGDIEIKISYRLNGREIKDSVYGSPSCVSLPSEHGTLVPTPKHDPCRLFKKGDKVKPAERHGRKTPKLNYKAEYTVTASEDDYGTVGVEYYNGAMSVSFSIPFYWLELVTPVEEMRPYSVHEESLHNRWNVIKDKYVHGIHAMFPYKNIGNSDLMSREEAKARADEYCDRLNAEYRKEQK